ncbi:TniQ family protein [Agarivorans aestuarii]|uniref:TniQ family protein n=1 Tax=Agarivorans aestuarii TaxID=1563703 RepID=A0ABU7G2V7_9ALTE|nr:TniQ family protein [Agarivorans aestuarii]MEE1673716.1 TniQ family protein [Agarivorans aestuarii]
MSCFLLLPGEDVLAAPARWHYLSRTGTLDDSVAKQGLSLTCKHPHQLFSTNAQRTWELLTQQGFDGEQNKHGLGLYQQAFLRADEQAKWQTVHDNPNMKGRLSTHVQRWRWCPECVSEDEAEYGVPYFHRDHQLPGVFHCQKHQMALTSSCPECGWHIKLLQHQNIPPYDNVCPECGCWIGAEAPPWSDAMCYIEQASLRLARTPYQPERLEASQGLVRAIAGLPAQGQRTLAERNRILAWQWDFINMFCEQDIKAWFQQRSLYKGRVISPLMRNSRLNLIESVAGPVHPLLHLMVEYYIQQTTRSVDDGAQSPSTAVTGRVLL